MIHMYIILKYLSSVSKTKHLHKYLTLKHRIVTLLRLAELCAQCSNFYFPDSKYCFISDAGKVLNYHNNVQFYIMFQKCDPSFWITLSTPELIQTAIDYYFCHTLKSCTHLGVVSWPSLSTNIHWGSRLCQNHLTLSTPRSCEITSKPETGEQKPGQKPKKDLVWWEQNAHWTRNWSWEQTSNLELDS